MLTWESVKLEIETVGFDTWICRNRDNADAIVKNTASKRVYVFGDFVVKFGGNDCFSEWELWHEVTVVSPNETMQDILIPIITIKESDVFRGKYWTVQPRVKCGTSFRYWYDEDENGDSNYSDFMLDLKNCGYYIDDIHQNNVTVDDEGYARVFDYSWWRSL